MTLFSIFATSRIFVFTCLIVTLVAGIIYFPGLTTEFGIIDDYTLLAIDKQNPEKFHLFQAVYFRGRPLGGWLLVGHALLLEKIADFAWWRLANLGAILFFFLLAGYFLRRQLKLPNFWILIFILSALVLPCVQMSVLKASHFTTAALTLVLASLSYLALQAFRDYRQRRDPLYGKNWYFVFLPLSFFLFTMTLFIYPLNSLIVWFFSFSRALVRPLSEWKQTRKLIGFDLIFFSLGLMAFRLLDRFCFVPFGFRQPWFDARILPQNTYSMDISWNIPAKTHFLIDSFTIALSGTWNIILPWQSPLNYGIALIVLGFILLTRNEPTSNPANPGFRWQRGLILLGLMILVNLPGLLAKGCFFSPGYRTHIPLSFMGSLGLCASAYWLNKNTTNKIVATGLKFICAAGLMALLLIGQQHAYDAVQNYHRELCLMRQEIKRFDPKIHQRLIVIYNNRFLSYTGRFFHREFAGMIRHRHDVVPFLKELRQSYPANGLSHILVVPPDVKKTMPSGPHDCVIDLNRYAFIQKN